MLGCPKFDDAAASVTKLAEIFRRASIEAVTVADMEVPCCARLPMIVKTALLRAGKELPIEEITISRGGGLIKRPARPAG